MKGEYAPAFSAETSLIGFFGARAEVNSGREILDLPLGEALTPVNLAEDCGLCGLNGCEGLA
jgi:hypothetical protein